MKKETDFSASSLAKEQRMRWVLLALFIVFIFLSVWWDMSLILLGFGCGAIVVLYGGSSFTGIFW